MTMFDSKDANVTLVSQLLDTKGIQPRLVRLADFLFSIAENLVESTAAARARSLVDAALLLEAVNYDLMRLVVEEMSIVEQCSNCPTRYETPCHALIQQAKELAEDIWADMPTNFVLGKTVPEPVLACAAPECNGLCTDFDAMNDDWPCTRCGGSGTFQSAMDGYTRHCPECDGYGFISSQSDDLEDTQPLKPLAHYRNHTGRIADIRQFLTRNNEPMAEISLNTLVKFVAFPRTWAKYKNWLLALKATNDIITVKCQYDPNPNSGVDNLVEILQYGNLIDANLVDTRPIVIDEEE